MESLLNTGEWEGDFLAKKIDGTHFISHGAATTVRNAKGERIGFQSANLDVSAQKKTEKALRETSNKLIEAQSLAHLGFWSQNVKSGEVEWSEEVFKIFGLDPDTFTPQIDSILALSPWPDGDGQSRLNEIINHAVESHTPGHYEQKFIRPDKSIGYYYSTFEGKYDENGELVLIVGTVLDITERKQAEEALRQSENSFRFLAENAKDMIYRMSLPDGTYEYVSPSSVELFGYTPSEFYNTPVLIQKAIHPDWQTYFDKEWGKLSAGNMAPTYEYQIIQKSGDIRWVNQRNALVKDENGKPNAIEGAVTDITERKEAEVALKEYSERLEEMVEERTRKLQETQDELVRQEKLATLGQLAGGVGHELRNPLGAIKNAAYFLNMVAEAPDPSTKEMLDLITREVANSERIISDLLDFARTRPPTRQKVALNSVLQETLARSAVPTQIEVISKLQDELPEIMADPDQLVQIFSNIIENGIQAMTSTGSAETPEGGQLSIETRLENPEWLAVTITDTGEGMSPDILEKIFEPLFTTRAKGIGLGLAIVKTLVEGHGGTIEAESKPGQGSVFTIRLPFQSEGLGE